MKARDKRLADLRTSIAEVGPGEARDLQAAGAVLLDVRDADEVAQGSPAGALRLGRSFLELRIEEAVPEFDRTLLLICGGGTRSLFAAEDLRRLGYADVRSVAGGFNAWKTLGLPVETPRILDGADRSRYDRHLLLPEVGEAGQIALLNSRVAIVGAGGLGSPSAFYLAAAGVGTLGIVDHDVVDRSNLQRQILHTDDRVGMPKVESAARTLRQLNPGIEIRPHPLRLSAANVESVLAGYDLVVDGSDNFATRYLANDACYLAGRTLVSAAIMRFDGQLSAFRAHRHDGSPCYRCLFGPQGEDPKESCADVGVLGALPGVMGALAAIEVVKELLGVGETMAGRLLLYEALSTTFRTIKAKQDPACELCGPQASIASLDAVDYTPRACAAE